MTAVIGLVAAAAGLLTAAASLVKAFRTQSNLDAHVSDPGAHQ